MNNVILDGINLISEYSKRAGADQFEALFYDNLSVDTSIRNQNLESIEQNKSCAFGIRILIGKKQAFTSSSDLEPSAIKIAIDRAIEMAKVTPDDDYIGLPDRSELATDITELDLFDDNIPSVKTMISDALEIENTALSIAGITNSEGASSSYSTSKIYLVNSLGTNLECRSTSFSKSISSIAGEGANMEHDYDYSVARNYNKLKSNDAIGKLAAQRAISKLNPKKIKTTKIAIILEPRIASRFLGSLASLTNGQAFVLGTSFLKDYLGKKIFNDNISVIDDPHIIGGLGSCPFDSEGVKNHKSAIIKNGVFETCMLDTYHARKLGKKTTGHARRGLSSPTHPGSSNFYLENGTSNLNDLIKSVDRVIVITDAFSSNLNPLTGDLSQGFGGHYYEHGELIHPVSELTFAGNLLDLYQNLIPANDLKFESTINSPSLFIPNVTVAGK